MSTRRHLHHRRIRSGNPSIPTLRRGDDLRKQRFRVPTTRCLHGKRRYFTRSDADVRRIRRRSDRDQQHIFGRPNPGDN